MTGFVQSNYPREHAGVARIEAAVAAVRQLRTKFQGAKGLAAMLLAAAVSALVVVADQVVSAWADGHLLLAWVVLWACVFAALALFSDPARRWVEHLSKVFDARAQRAAQRAADESAWAIARTDPRIMADLQAARLRAEREALANGEPLPYWPFANAPANPLQQYQPY